VHTIADRCRLNTAASKISLGHNCHEYGAVHFYVFYYYLFFIVVPPKAQKIKKSCPLVVLSIALHATELRV